MTDFTITATLDTDDPSDELIDTVLDGLAEYDPIFIGAPGGATVQIWLPAKNLTQALTTAIALLGPRVPMVGLSALPRTIADARAADTYIPPLLSTTEVARRLGISRQAVTQRLAAGTLPGRRAGNTWVVAEADIPAGRAGDDTGRRTQQGI